VNGAEIEKVLKIQAIIFKKWLFCAAGIHRKSKQGAPAKMKSNLNQLSNARL
jgi:hypothetical protein